VAVVRLEPALRGEELREAELTLLPGVVQDLQGATVPGRVWGFAQKEGRWVAESR
jgi:hypothetical protein